MLTSLSTFAGPYRGDGRLKLWLRKAMATGYLPPNHLRRAFRTFCTSRDSRQLLRRYPALQDFIDYMEATYVGEQALFPIRAWCVFGRRGDNRSNNWVEGKHFFFFFFYI